MRRSFLWLSSVLFLGIAAASLPAQEYVWLEGEAPTRANVKFETGGWGRAEYLSGGKWLFANIEPKDIEAKIPADGAVLSYDFEAKAAGDYEVWRASATSSSARRSRGGSITGRGSQANRTISPPT